MEQRYRLELLGITYNQIESGVYALILQQVGTNRRIPIIIGFPEAQAIECKLQDIKTPRPLTHDIMIQSLESFGITIKSVVLKRLSNGVFAADLYLSDGYKDIIIDARSSDAVALAIRTGAPIYTTEDVLKESSFDPDEIRKSKKQSVKDRESEEEYHDTPSFSEFDKMSLDQLKKAMAKAAENEDYEEAARIKSEIDARKQTPPSQPND